MRVIEIAGPGGPDVLRVAERPTPEPRAGEVLIRIAAAGVNRPDIMQRLGKYPPPSGASDIPGLEVSGEVVAVNGVALGAGQQVCALVSGGGYADYCAVPAEQCLPVPAGVPLVDAAAIPETFFTVWTNLFDRGGLRAGERVLVHGGTSGIGTTAIQLASVRGVEVLATAGTAEKVAACTALGAAHAINYQTDDFVAAVKDATHGEGVDVVLDIVGGEYVPRNLECLRKNGRLVQIGLIAGSKTAFDLRPILQRHLTITGSVLRPRSPAEKGAIARELEREVWPLLARGAVRPIVHGEFPLARAADAHRELESGRVIGKLILLT
jgi:putative PIG3 family NAD(P)H quinone oxidoreductase